MLFNDMHDWSNQKFENHWLEFSELDNDGLINLRDQFEENQPELFNYVLSVGNEHPLSESSRAILIYMTLAIWSFMVAQEEIKLKSVNEGQILEIERGNAQIFSTLENTDSFQINLLSILESYPAKELFLYIGQSISSRDLGREDRSITADQRGWMILYLKVVLDTLLVNIEDESGN